MINWKALITGAIFTFQPLTTYADAYDDCVNGSGSLAIQGCSNLISSNGNDDENLRQIFQLRAFHHSMNANYVAAIKDYSAAIKLGDDEYSTHYSRAFSYNMLGHFEQSIEDLEIAISLNPDALQAYDLRAEVFASSGQHALAIEDLTKLLALDATFPNAFQRRGYSYLTLNKYTLAISDLSHQLTITPRNIEAINLRAISYYGAKEYSKAVIDFGFVIEHHPNDAVHLTNYGKSSIFLGAKAYDQAIANFDKAILLSPSYAPAFYGRAKVLYLKQDFDAALVAYNVALGDNPSDVTALIERANTHNNLGDTDKAYADYSVAIKLDPNDNRARFLRGWMMLEAGRLAHASDDAIALIDADARNPQFQEFAANVYTKEGNRTFAFGSYTRVIKFGGDKFFDLYMNELKDLGYLPEGTAASMEEFDRAWLACFKDKCVMRSAFVVSQKM